MELSQQLKVIAMNAEQRQMAADLWTKPTNFSYWPACRQLGNHIHHRHLFDRLIKVDTHFTHPMEGRRLSRPCIHLAEQLTYATLSLLLSSTVILSLCLNLG